MLVRGNKLRNAKQSARRTAKPQFNPRRVLRLLTEARVSFVVMGGAAMVAHGFRREVDDLDLIYRRSRINMSRLARSLAAIHPRPRGVDSSSVAAPDDVVWNYRTVADGYTFITTTDCGDLDLFAEITGGGTWEDLVGETVRLKVFGVECDCLSIPQLIASKLATGRAKDRRTARELQRALNDQRGASE